MAIARKKEINLGQHFLHSIFDDNLFSCDILSVNRYFICPIEKINQKNMIALDCRAYYHIQKNQIESINDFLIDSYGLSVGHFISVTDELHFESGFNEIIKKFRLSIIQSWIEQLHHSLDCVWKHLRNRGPALQKIGQQSVVQISIGNVLSHLRAAEVACNNDNEYQLALNECQAATELLARLQGGRAFLSEGAIELTVVFQYFRKIYFS